MHFRFPIKFFVETIKISRHISDGFSGDVYVLLVENLLTFLFQKQFFNSYHHENYLVAQKQLQTKTQLDP